MRRLVLTLVVASLTGALTVPSLAATQEQRPVPAAKAASAPVNLNTASVAQLETLPGIGVKTAERIVEYRQKNGSFKKIEELMNVKGIGEKSFLKLKPLVTVTPAKAERAGSGVQQ